MKALVKPLHILFAVIAVLITELGLFMVFTDTLMRSRNSAIGSAALMLAFIFPVLIVPVIGERTRKHAIAICFITATLCMTYFLAIYKNLLLDQDMLLMLLSYIVVVIITAILLRTDGLPA